MPRPVPVFTYRGIRYVQVKGELAKKIRKFLGHKSWERKLIYVGIMSSRPPQPFSQGKATLVGDSWLISNGFTQ